MTLTKGLGSSLDASRWIAALMVMLSHAHHVFLANYPDVEVKRWIWRFSYFLGSFGGEAVVIFFVVSGFLVGGLTADKWVGQRANAESLNVRHYFVQRVSRIYTVLLPALCLGGAIDFLGSSIFDESRLYSDAKRFEIISLDWPVILNLNLPDFLGNLAMLQNILVPVWGSNGPLWSLAYEWWYYCIFAALMYSILGQGIFRVYAMLFLVAFVWMLPAKLFLSMLLWWLGVGAYLYLKLGFFRPRAVLGVLVLLAGLTIARFNHPEPGVASSGHAVVVQFSIDFCLALTYCFALVSFANVRFNETWSKVHSTLASFSYSSYLTHFPLLIFLASLFKQSFGIDFLRQPSLGSYALLTMVIGGLVVVGCVFSVVTERHTKKIAECLERLVLVQGVSVRR